METRPFNNYVTLHREWEVRPNLTTHTKMSGSSVPPPRSKPHNKMSLDTAPRWIAYDKAKILFGISGTPINSQSVRTLTYSQALTSTFSHTVDDCVTLALALRCRYFLISIFVTLHTHFSFDAFQHEPISLINPMPKRCSHLGNTAPPKHSKCSWTYKGMSRTRSAEEPRHQSRAIPNHNPTILIRIHPAPVPKLLDRANQVHRWISSLVHMQKYTNPTTDDRAAPCLKMNLFRHMDNTVPHKHRSSEHPHTRMQHHLLPCHFMYMFTATYSTWFVFTQTQIR